MRHVDFAIEFCPLHEVGQAGAVVHMKVSHQEQLDFLRVDPVEVGQLLDSLTAWMESTIEHDLAAFALKVDAAASNLAAGAKRRDFEDFAALRVDLVRHAHLKLAQVNHVLNLINLPMRH